MHNFVSARGTCAFGYLKANRTSKTHKPNFTRDSHIVPRLRPKPPSSALPRFALVACHCALTSFWTSESDIVCIIFILQAVLNTPFFVWGFSSSERIYYTSQTHQAFQRLNESCCRTRIPVALVPNFEIKVNNCFPLNVFLIYQWKKCGKFYHMSDTPLIDHFKMTGVHRSRHDGSRKGNSSGYDLKS